MTVDRWNLFEALQDRVGDLETASARVDDPLYMMSLYFDDETMPERRYLELAARVDAVANHIRAATVYLAEKRRNRKAGYANTDALTAEVREAREVA